MIVLAISPAYARQLQEALDERMIAIAAEWAAGDEWAIETRNACADMRDELTSQLDRDAKPEPASDDTKAIAKRVAKAAKGATE